jgi:hypothetical protein
VLDKPDGHVHLDIYTQAPARPQITTSNCPGCLPQADIDILGFIRNHIVIE